MNVLVSASLLGAVLLGAGLAVSQEAKVQAPAEEPAVHESIVVQQLPSQDGKSKPKAVACDMSVVDPLATAQPTAQPTIEVVFTLDTTGSMSELIEGAKRKIWSIANQIATGVPTPRIR